MASAGKVECRLHVFALSSDWFIRLYACVVIGQIVGQLWSPVYDNCDHVPKSTEKRHRGTRDFNIKFTFISLQVFHFEETQQICNEFLLL